MIDRRYLDQNEERRKKAITNALISVCEVAAIGAVCLLIGFNVGLKKAKADVDKPLYVKPVPAVMTMVKETPPEAIVIEAEPESTAPEIEWESAGSYTITYYCPCRSCSGKWGRQTASGATAEEGRTVAVDKDVIPLGTHIMIDGHEYIAEDVGGGVDGKHIDIFMESHAQCVENGVQKKEVFLKN